MTWNILSCRSWLWSSSPAFFGAYRDRSNQIRWS